MQTRWRTGPALVAALGAFVVSIGSAHADCVTPANAIEAENCLPGNPPTEWDVSGSGDANIQGFATDMSVNRGETVQFKVATAESSYQIDIYRLGYYGGDGARKVATVLPSATLPQSQPACLTDSTGLVDCGNWAVSASWPVPANAVSGIYIARLVRTGGASHVIFIVRQDGGSSDLLFQTADTTWQAYNRYGGNSFYQGTGPGGGLSGVGRAYKVSYNRPMTTRDYAQGNFLFNSEYPMVRWLEQNGYDVSYFSGVDTDRLGPELARHKAFLSVGHDEYWSKQQRLNVEGARDQQFPGQAAPVHLAFFSGNDVFWKTRWEPSISSPATAHRTLVCYKETHEGANIDPSPEWTGTWRDVRPINTEGPNPENALTGTIFTVNCCAYPLELRVPDAQMRIWRNTPNVSQLTGAQVWTGPSETIGYEWNEDLDNGFRPAGLVRLSTTTRNVPERILDNGSTYGPGTATHSLVFHKRPSGALVFSAGTIQWSWGLDSNHDRGSEAPSPDMQQATVNLFADMGVQPATLDPLLVPASASTDVVAAASQLTSPANNAVVPVSVPLTIQGTASDAAPGRVGGVEVSVDGGLTWHPATGRGTWSYVWTPAQNGTYTIVSRAVDDSGNLETPGAGRTIFVGSSPPPSGGFSIWAGAGSPALTNLNDGQAIGLGVKFRSSIAGQITAIRFYKGDQDTGTHVGRLWTATGTVLATATFSGETASGWQEVQLPSPVSITANTTYVASYHSSAGYYVATGGYFTQAVVNGPLTALADGTDGPNGLYRYDASAFPDLSHQQGNYWADVVFRSTDATPPTVTGVNPPSGASGVASSTNVTATFDEDMAPSTVNGANVELRDPAAQLVPATVTWDPATRTALLDPTASLAFSTTYTATVRGGTGGVTDVEGNPLAGDVTWTFTSRADTLQPDTIPPTITATAPSNGASDVAVGTNVTATFDEDIAPSTVNGANVQLRDPADQLVPATVTWDPATRTAFLDPTANLAFSTTYTATVRGGIGGVTDVADNPLAGDVTWTFTTEAAPPPPEEGPGGPILVIAHSANPFARYYAEILRAEGLNAFKSLDISVVDASALSTYDVAILGEMPLTSSQVTMLTDWVNAGGNLIAMRPDNQLAGLLGLTAGDGTLGEAYLQVNTGSAPGLGIVGQTIQFHGTADQYTLAQATAVATLFSNATTATTNPAVSLRSVGLGKAAAFTFDLARSIVYTRQGNPAWAGDERDGIAPIRSDDLFYGAKAGDVQPDWVDLGKVAIPQADEQQRLLANLILHMNRDRKPLPRFWYFPFGKRAVVVMTSDNHSHGAEAESRLDRQLTQDPPGCDVNRWECVRSSLYLYPGPFDGAASYQAQGFEIGVHINTDCTDYTPTSLASFFTEQLGEFGTLPQFAGIAPPTTNRTHCVAWSDWATHAKVSLQNGIRLDTNYYYWPGPWVANRPGHFTGSGMPMRFADLDGALIDVYQAATQITDESLQTEPFTIDTLLDRALGTEGYYAAITANIHSDNGDDSLSDFIVDSAQTRGVPVVSARQMLTWLDGRNGSSFEAITWNDDVLTFGIEVGAGANGLEAMLPWRGAGPRLLTTLTRGGIAVPYSTQTVKGVEYVVFAADPGTYQATYTIDVTPPVISALSASVGNDGTATVQWLTDESATTVVQYGTAPASLTQTVTVPLFVTHHSALLTGLSGNTTYYYQVTSADPSGNSATSDVSSFQVPNIDTAPPAVTLVRPTGGERVFAGTPYVLQWTATDNVGVTAVDVAFSSNGGSSFTAIAECTGLPGTAQTCAWTAPGPTTTQGRIRVTAHDGAGLSGSATSNTNFNVVAGTASLTLTAPTTAVTWRIGNTQSVSFNHNLGVGQRVGVDLSRDGGATWTTINPAFVTTNSSSGTVPWVVSGPVTGTARVRVRWSGNPAITGANAVNFTIVNRISITTPNIAVTWPIGSARSIAWNHNLGAAGTVNIDLSRDGGATWSPVAAGVANGAATTGTFSWVVGAPATTTARIRVTSVADPTITSVSAVNFTISGSITATDPNGSSTWSIGSTQTVSWNHNLGAGQTFALDLSTDNGVTFPTSIATSVAGGSANGTYTWVVPGPETITARIRVRWSSSSAVAGTTGSFRMVAP